MRLEPTDSQDATVVPPHVYGNALRDQMSDTGRDGPNAPTTKDGLGHFIENSLDLNSKATQDRNPGGRPNSPLGPN